MNAIELVNAEIGTVSSRQDGSVAFRVITAELRPSEAGLLCQFHGKAARVLIAPHEGTPEEVVHVTTERDAKTPGQRLRNCLFVYWQQEGAGGNFEHFYAEHMEKLIRFVKDKLT